MRRVVGKAWIEWGEDLWEDADGQLLWWNKASAHWYRLPQEMTAAEVYHAVTEAMMDIADLRASLITDSETQHAPMVGMEVRHG